MRVCVREREREKGKGEIGGDRERERVRKGNWVIKESKREKECI